MLKAVNDERIYKEFKVVHIRFWDHLSSNAKELEPCICETVGVLREETKLAYWIISWIYNSNLGDENSEGYCILKSTVLEYNQLEVSNEAKNERRYKRSKKANRRNGK